MGELRGQLRVPDEGSPLLLSREGVRVRHNLISLLLSVTPYRLGEASHVFMIESGVAHGTDASPLDRYIRWFRHGEYMTQVLSFFSVQ